MEPWRSGSGWLSIEHLLRAHARRDAARTALFDVDKGERICFGDLALVVEGVALQLRSHGVSQGARVVLLIDSSIETVVVWLALWRLAAVVCPFDISQIGAASTQAAFRTLKPLLVLHGQRIGAPDLQTDVAPCVRFGQWPVSPSEVASIRLLPASGREPPLGEGAQPHDVAAACCTSGSGGRMKIVLHDHASYWLNGLASTHLLGLVPKDHLLEYRSLSWYSPQILSLMPFLQTGLALHLARQFSAKRFPEWIEHQGITVCSGVPTVLNILLSQPMQRLRECATSLRVMTSSSAPLAARTWQRFERESGICIINLYGSSECGWMCGNRLDDRRVGTVGRPVPGMAIDVVDASGRSCAPGEPGELVVEGEKLALGMLQADGRLQPIRGQRFFTRDLACRDEDGFVRLLGRMDDLVIRGGVKISPSEIEDVLLTHVDVSEAAAVGVPDPIYGQEAICFVVLRENASADAESLRQFAGDALPREKRPRAVVVIDTLPRNARGKLRRDVLRHRWQDALADRETGR